MTGKELADLAKQAQRQKTAYCKGAFGAPLNQKNATRYKYEGDVDPQRFAFDCCGLWHALCSGWNADSSKTYGGTVVNQEKDGISYGIFRIPDWGADGAFSKNYLEDISSDMKNIQVGEILWVPGHNGIYVGNGYAIEATPKWEGGVQISQFKDPKAFHYREWLQHGRLPFLTYEDEESSYPHNMIITCPCCGAKFVKEE